MKALVDYPLSHLCQVGVKAAGLLERHLDELHGATDDAAEHFNCLSNRQFVSGEFKRLTPLWGLVAYTLVRYGLRRLP
jgi:hypothetical protein